MALHRNRPSPLRWAALLGATAWTIVPVGSAAGHSGPPFPIVVDERVGPHRVSIWGDPDVGVGTFYVILEAGSEAAASEDFVVAVAARPSSGRLGERRYQAVRDATEERVQFTAQVEFDREEMWDLRFSVRSASAAGEIGRQVEVTPAGFGPLDLALYLFPFAAVALLWIRAVFARRDP
jgi:hypothetical protein